MYFISCFIGLYRCSSCIHYLSWLFRASLCIAAYLSWHCWASLVSSSSHGCASQVIAWNCRRFSGIVFFTGLYSFLFLLNHLSWHRRASLASLPILPRASVVASLGIAAHRWASHRCVSLLAWLGISRFFTASYGWVSQAIAGNCWPFLENVFFLQDYMVFHSRFTISPGIAGHRGHRCVSLLASLGIFRFLGIAAHRWASQLSFSSKPEMLQT